jgi:hypothetical protein
MRAEDAHNVLPTGHLQVKGGPHGGSGMRCGAMPTVGIRAYEPIGSMAGIGPASGIVRDGTTSGAARSMSPSARRIPAVP